MKMSRKCVITGKKPMVGHNVSHANNKTKRRFLPNIMETKLFSEALGKTVRVKLSAHGLRILDKKGGIDGFVTSTAKTKLDPSLRALKAEIEKAKSAQ
jgi:large subunit ribosomal protein L28